MPGLFPGLPTHPWGSVGLAHPGSARVFSVPDASPPHADVAQLVEHHLAKVRVASSSLVVRSEEDSTPSLFIESCQGLNVPGLVFPVEWPRGEATACKAVYTGSNPVSTSGDWRSGSALP